MNSKDFLINHLSKQIEKAEKKLTKMKQLLQDQSEIERNIQTLEKQIKEWANLLHDVDCHKYPYVN